MRVICRQTFHPLIQQCTLHVPMDNNCAPLIADLFVFCFEKRDLKMSLTISRLILTLSTLHRYFWMIFFKNLKRSLLKNILIIRRLVITVMYCNRLRAVLGVVT